nr:transposase [Vibrio ouci]
MTPRNKLKDYRKYGGSRCGIQPLINFARKRKPYLHGIVASASYHLNTCTLEGINNKIKLIERMGYGYRDTDYFFLKIKAAFPGNRDEPIFTHNTYGNN